MQTLTCESSLAFAFAFGLGRDRETVKEAFRQQAEAAAAHLSLCQFDRQGTDWHGFAWWSRAAVGVL